MKKKFNANKVRLHNTLKVIILLFFVILIIRLLYLALAVEIDGINIKTFESNRNTAKKTINARRGTIYDSAGNPLAQTVNSYTVIAFLESGRGEGYYVKDKEATAKALSPVLGMSEESLLYLLNKNAYQVELGPGGRNITELKKDEVKALNLDGIGFSSSYKRYYQNDDFASYVLGYVKKDDNNKLNGEMGIEMYYNDLLNGEDGFTIYQQDVYGYKIPNTKEETKESTDGVDIYLTLDSNIQFFAEKYSKEAYEKYSPDWLVTVVTDAKTGKILASTSYPSFNPNTLNITNYLNPLVSYAYEPGSTFKTFTYMAALEKGVYKGNDTFESGSIKVGNNVIYDWRVQGFGTITYDEGFLYSSNVGITNLIKKNLNKTELKEYYEKFGFGKKTGIELPGELAGSLNFNYDIEVYNAGFGQGITITPVQMMQALSIIANDGVMLKPYIVDKVVDTDKNEIIYEGTKQELGRVAKKETTDYMKQLMYDVIYNDLVYSTGAAFKLKGYDLIGKTGTAQYTDGNGNYYYDELHYIRSFAGMFPKDDPEIIVYVALKKPYSSAAGLNLIVRGLVKDISNYKGIYNENINTDATSYIIGNYLNKDIKTVKEDLENKFSEVVVIGNGNKIINQYPKANSKLSVTEKVYLVTIGDITIPDFTNWSLREVDTYSHLSNLKYKANGTGYVYSQTIDPGAIMTDDVIELNFKNKNQEKINENVK